MSWLSRPSAWFAYPGFDLHQSCKPLPECLYPSQAQEAQRWWPHSDSPVAGRCGICQVPETQGELTYSTIWGKEKKAELGYRICFIKYQRLFFIQNLCTAHLYMVFLYLSIKLYHIAKYHNIACGNKRELWSCLN